MGSQNSNSMYRDPNSISDNPSDTSGIGGSVAFDTINGQFEVSGMNKRVEINNNRAIMRISGVNNSIFVKNNYSSVVILGVNNRITIDYDFSNGKITNPGVSNTVVIINRGQRPNDLQAPSGNRRPVENRQPNQPPPPPPRVPPPPANPQASRPANIPCGQNVGAPPNRPAPLHPVNRPPHPNMHLQANREHHNRSASPLMFRHEFAQQPRGPPVPPRPHQANIFPPSEMQMPGYLPHREIPPQLHRYG